MFRKVQTLPRLLIAGLLLLSTACVTIGHKFDPSRADQLVPNQSTEGDAARLLGRPTTETFMADGTRLLQWSYSQGTALGTGSGAAVSILFTAEGKMIRLVQRSKTTLR